MIRSDNINNKAKHQKQDEGRALPENSNSSTKKRGDKEIPIRNFDLKYDRDRQ